jgi:hypothetical protein
MDPLIASKIETLTVRDILERMTGKYVIPTRLRGRKRALIDFIIEIATADDLDKLIQAAGDRSPERKAKTRGTKRKRDDR